MKYAQKTSPEGKPAIYCERGTVCQFEAGYQQAREQDAAFVVRACNAHDELVAALENCVDVMVRAVGERLPVQIGSECEESDWIHDLKAARAALAKAKSER